MAYSYNEVVGTGGPQLVAVPEYIDQTHISVRVGGVPTLDYTWVNDQTVSVTAPFGVAVRVLRSSSPGERVVDYLDGDSLTEVVLDNDSRQAFFLAQEQLDATDEAVEAIGSLPDALAAIQAETAESFQNKTAAEAAQGAAETAQAAAETAQAASEAARDESTTQATNSAASAATASGHKDAAAASASAASGSATVAAASATTAGNEATAAANSAAAAASSASSAASSSTSAATSASDAAAAASAAEAFSTGLPRVTTGGLTRANVNGKVFVTAAGLTIPANVFQEGDIFGIENSSSSSIVLTSGVDLSMRDSGSGGSLGNRSLGAYGLAVLRWVNGTFAFVSGPGVS